jgi:polyhydroxyalkanoate synthesis regulator phasin
MNGHRLWVACLLVLSACASTQVDVADWAGFVDEVDRLSPEELGLRLADTDRHFRTAPDDLTRLQLGYLLSRPVPGTQDVEAGRALLGEIDADSPYSALRDLVQKQVAVEGALQSARREVAEQNSQIEVLRQQVSELEPRVHRETELQALREKVGELEAKLEALKTIEAEMAKGQKAMDELPDE